MAPAALGGQSAGAALPRTRPPATARWKKAAGAQDGTRASTHSAVAMAAPSPHEAWTAATPPATRRLRGPPGRVQRRQCTEKLSMKEKY